MCFRLFAPTVLALLATFGVAAAQEFSLEFKFTKGEIRRYKSTITTQGVVEGQRTQVTTLVTEIYETHRVDSVYEDGSADVTLIRDSVAVTENRKRVRRDQEEEVVGVPLTYRVSKSGSLTTVRALERFTSKERTIYENVLKNLEKRRGLVPEKRVSFGDSWEFEIPISQRTPAMSIEGTVKTKFTFAGTERCAGNDCAVIRASGTTSVYISGEQYSGTITGTTRGSMRFSIQFGKDLDWFLNSELSGELQSTRGTVKTRLVAGIGSELIP